MGRGRDRTKHSARSTTKPPGAGIATATWPCACSTTQTPRRCPGPMGWRCWSRPQLGWSPMPPAGLTMPPHWTLSGICLRPMSIGSSSTARSMTWMGSCSAAEPSATTSCGSLAAPFSKSPAAGRASATGGRTQFISRLPGSSPARSESGPTCSRQWVQTGHRRSIRLARPACSACWLPTSGAEYRPRLRCSWRRGRTGLSGCRQCSRRPVTEPPEPYEPDRPPPPLASGRLPFLGWGRRVSGGGLAAPQRCR